MLRRPHRRGVITDFASPSAYVRSHVALYEQLCVTLADDRHPLVVVAGPSRGEGRTTVATNLAACSARVGARRTLLVDADLAQPALSRRHAAPGAAGLSDVLAGRAQWQDCLHAMAGTDTLFFMPAGNLREVALPAAPAERVAALVREWCEAFDWVVVDAPPLLASAAAIVLGKHASGAVLVVQAGRTRVEVVRQATARLKESSVRPLGVVLNRRRFFIPRYAYRRL